MKSSPRSPVVQSLLLAVVASSALAQVASFAASGEAAPASPAPPARHNKSEPPRARTYPAWGEVERFSPELDALIPPGTPIEKLAGGFDWSEGPVWNRKTKTLLFSDVPRNVVFEWKEGRGTRDFFIPSGFTGQNPRGGEQGSNGLALDKDGRLVLCQHGDRRVARLDPPGKFTTLAQYYKDRRFNSPNDLVFHSNGDLYFTDPPYGLEQGEKDPAKELLFNGVYLVRHKTGEVILLDDKLKFPNGIAFSPDEKTLYVAVSDPANPVIMAYDVQPDGTVTKGRVFFDARELAATRKGLPDGLKVDVKGNLFATGPGGVLVITPQGKLLGIVKTGELISNCAWGDKGSTLYLTCDDYLGRLKTTTKGKGF